jgi:cobalamin biosynthesis protein CbiG
MHSLTIGVGFRQGVSVEQIEAAVRTAFESLPAPAPHTMADVACVATLDSKAREPALVAFCERHRVPLLAFSAQDVQACFRERPSLRASPIVSQHAGVEGVCEPCALLASPGGRLVRSKVALSGVTVAIAASDK